MGCSVRREEGTRLTATMIPKAALIDGASRVADDAMEDSAWDASNR